MAVFREWRAAAEGGSPLHHPDAVCVSTVDADGNPDARFVDLKAVHDEGFVFCTSVRSHKGVQLGANPHVALTFWWDHVGRQVRVRGTARRIPDAEADGWFAARPRDAQLASWAFDQSAPLGSSSPDEAMADARRRFAAGPIPRPEHWGGYLVVPDRVELLDFDESRVHRRRLFERTARGWEESALQP